MEASQRYLPNTASIKPPAPSIPFKGLLWNALGRRLVALMILGSTVLAMGAAAVQLYLGYQRDRAELVSAFEVVETSFLNSLQNALWQFNFDQTSVLLDGIHAQAGVEYLHLSAATGQAWTRGQTSSEQLSRSYPLTFQEPSGTETMVGTLVVGLTLDQARSRLWGQFLTLASSNLVKTLLASLVMLALYHRLVGRHLRDISAQIGVPGWATKSRPVHLDRKQRPADELDAIVETLNDARQEIVESYGRLQDRAALLERANQRLADANREQSEFTYAISHDLKAPVNTLRLLMGELSREDSGALTGDGRQTLELAERTATRMSTLVDDVLAYARAVGQDSGLTDVDLNEVVSGVVQDLHADTEEAGALVRVSSLPMVRGHPPQLRMLFQNLISNALKFRHKDRLPEIRIKENSDGDRTWVVIEVQDNGIGIAPEYHDRIFGMFQRLHTQSEFAGSGLGLTLCRRIVNNLGGKIEIKSQSKGGAIFSVSLLRTENGGENQYGTSH